MRALLVAVFLLLGLLAGFAQGRDAQAGTVPPGTVPPAPGVRLAVIGDFGMDNAAEAGVAELVAGWQPDAVVTTGDNNYPSGAAATIDANIGKYYHAFIHPYTGSYGPGATVNRFFPTLGNHDWYSASGTPPAPLAYTDYFSLPTDTGNERYYAVRLGPVHLFAVDSDPQEPDGITAGSAQGRWLQDALRNSDAPWKLVFMHHPPYSSSQAHGSTPALQWPYREWGAHGVFAGHDHTYERLAREGFPYFVNGIGGAALYPFGTPLPESLVRYNANHGAMRIDATALTMTVRLFDVENVEQDRYDLYQAAYLYLPGVGKAP